MKTLLFSLSIACVSLSSCSGCFLDTPSAKCRLIYQGADVVVEDDSFAKLQEMDTIFLWNVAEQGWDVAEGNMYTFVFADGADGPINAHVAKAIIVKIFR